MSCLRKVKFKQLDNDNQYIRAIKSKARKISRYVDNKEIFDILCIFLLKFRTIEYYKANFKTWCKNTLEYADAFDIENINDFCNEILKTYSEFKDDKQVSDFRGKIFEVIMKEKISPSYCNRDSIMGCGCEVIICNKEIIYKDVFNNTDCNKKTVDIAGYNSKDTEFYEIKVGPKNFKYNIILYLDKLFNEANRKKITQNLNVGCVTMEKRTSLIQNLEIEKKKYAFSLNLNYENLKIKGREDIEERFFS